MSNIARKSMHYDDSGKWNRYLTYFVAFFTIICAVRWNVGSDCLSYARMFARGHISDLNKDKEALWTLFVRFIYEHDLHWTIGMGIVAFAQILFLTLSLRKYQFILVMLPFVLFGGCYWGNLVGAMRQMVVACAFVYASWFIVERKWIKYLIFIALSIGIHSSATLLLPFILWPPKFNMCNKRMILLIIFAVCFILGLTPQFTGMSKYMTFMQDMSNNTYGETLSMMLTTGYNSEAKSYGPMMISYVAITVFLIWYGPELYNKYAKTLPTFNIWFNFAYIYSCLYFLVCNISHLFIRPVLYLLMFQMIMAALLLHYLWHEYRLHGRKQGVTILFCCVIAMNTVWEVYKTLDISPSGGIVTYKLYFMNMDKVKYFNL